MKRTLVLIRHAKSDWGNDALRDYDRPLNARGLRDAPELGKRLRAKNFLPDLIVASMAQRAAETARLVAEGMGFPKEKIQWEEMLYHAPPSVMEDVLFSLADDFRRVFLVAHNPGISQFAQQLLPHFSLDEMLTCCAVAIETDAERWTDLPLAKKNLLFIDTPKNPSEKTY